jgi:DNA-binding NarL/FixJ family response regulator
MLEFPVTQLTVEKEVAYIRVIVADDHPIVRSGIKNELLRYPDVQVLSEAANGQEAINQAEILQPDVLLLDINMPGLKAVQVVQKLRALPSPPEVLILTAYGDEELVMALLKAGAKGYLLKDDDPRMIIEGVRTVAQGQTYLSQTVATSVVEYIIQGGTQSSEPTLSGREIEVLKLVAQGWSNTQIAQALEISEGTVKNHLTNLYNKVGVHSRAELVVWAWQRRLLDEN